MYCPTGALSSIKELCACPGDAPRAYGRPFLPQIHPRSGTRHFPCLLWMLLSPCITLLSWGSRGCLSWIWHVDLCSPAGELCFFHLRTWHGGRVRQSDKPRFKSALAVWLRASFLTSLSLCSLVVVVLIILPVNPLMWWMRTDREKGAEVLSQYLAPHTHLGSDRSLVGSHCKGRLAASPGTGQGAVCVSLPWSCGRLL